MPAGHGAGAGIRRSKAAPGTAGRRETAGDGDSGSPPGAGRRRPTLAETDRLTDALRVTRAVLRRIAGAGGRVDASDAEAVRSAIAAADAALGGPA